LIMARVLVWRGWYDVLCLSQADQDLPSLYLQPQVAFVLRPPLRPSTGRTGAFGDATCSPGPLLSPTRVLDFQRQSWASGQHRPWEQQVALFPRTPGALEVVSRGLCLSPARLIAHPWH